MLKQNQNRGAGLVTVVTVLAVCSILLAGVVALSFNHYKNAIRQTQSREELAEIELFAELVNKAMNENASPEDAFNSELLISFYNASDHQSGSTFVFEKIIVEVITEEDKKIYRVKYGEGDTVRDFYFNDVEKAFVQEVEQ